VTAPDATARSEGGRAGATDAFPRGPVLVIAGLVVLGLLLLSPLYGFHRDELYFIVAGQHPAWGYDDQGPLTPILSAAAVALLGLSPTAVRVLPALAIGACVVITALLARDLGGTRRAQVIAAGVVAVSGYLAAGHLDSTTTFDLLAWSVVLWLTTRLLHGADPRLWVLVGVTVGIGLENKFILLFLGASLIGGLLLTRRWDVLRSRWAWAGLAIAVAIWAPNLAWQAANGFPQLQMAGRIGGSADNRVKVIPELLLLAGPALFPVAIAGEWRLLRDEASRPWRSMGVAVLLLLALVLVTGGKSYYAAGIFPPLMAAGAISLDHWLRRGAGSPVRPAVALTAGGLSFAVVAVLVLPVLPSEALAASPIPGIYAESAEQLGWPQLVSTVATTADALPADQRARAVILTDNYGEAGALELLGADLPPVYSGHNAYSRWGPPPDGRTVAIVVTHATTADFGTYWGLGACTRVAAVDNGLGLDNQEQGVGVWLCPRVSKPWLVAWPSIRHLD
jgi:4-amino-4-deoxy-L-arabinose transferase-like glycosyltransferase